MRGGINWEARIYRCTAIYKINKDLLCSTECKTQYLVINYNGKIEKQHTYRHIYIIKSLCYTPETKMLL